MTPLSLESHVLIVSYTDLHNALLAGVIITFVLTYLNMILLAYLRTYLSTIFLNWPQTADHR
jgi:hypothetical protein